MKQFIQATSKGGNCDVCGRKTQNRDKCFIVLNTDSMEYLCGKCGDYFWSVLNSLMVHFTEAIETRNNYSLKQPIKEG